MKLKKALHLIRVTALLIIATTIIIKNANAQIADTVLTNGQFYTMNSVNPWAEAVAFVNGTIIYTGDMSGVSEHIDAETEVINLIRLKSLKVINPNLFSVIAEKYVEFLALLKEFELKSFSEIKEVPSVKKYLKIEEQEGLIFNSSEDYDEKYDDFSD